MEKRLKRGTKRADGKVLWKYEFGVPIYITEKQYNSWENTRKEYVRKCHNAYKARQLAKPPNERNFLGKYDPFSNRYFIGITSAGKEIWGTKEQLAKKRADMNIRRKKFAEKCKNLNGDPSKLKFGDQHPTDPKLFVILKIGNKVYYGSKERMSEVKLSRALAYRKRNVKAQRKRKEYLDSLPQRFTRGDKHPTADLYFWAYTQYAKEVWYTKEEFAIRRINEINRRKRYRNKLKSRK